MQVCVWHAWHLVLFSTTLLIVVKDILPDVLPAIMVSGDMVDTLLEALIASPAAVEEDSQQQHCKTHTVQRKLHNLLFIGYEREINAIKV